MAELIFPSAAFPGRMIAAFGEVIEPRLQDEEDLGDVLVGSSKLALRRAVLLQREPLPVDMEYVLSMWCWWPFKPELTDEGRAFLLDRRFELFKGAASEPSEDRLDEVRDEILMHTVERLHEMQRAEDWPSFVAGRAEL